MNRTHTILVITVLTAGVVGWQMWPQAPNDSAEPPEVKTQATSASLPSSADESAGSSADPTLPAAVLELPTAQQLEQFGCHVSDQLFDTETSQYRDVYTCPPAEPDLNPAEPHPYESWNNATLASLAYGDPKAAEVLGLRHVMSAKPEEEALGLSLLYRSAALSGDPEVFRKAIGQRYAYLSVNGKPQLHNLRQLLVFNLIGKKLGAKRFDPIPVETALRNANRSSEEIHELYQAADQILHSMAQVQSEITGNTTIAEVIADA